MSYLHPSDIRDETINTGIFQPPESQSIWLFVNEKKEKGATQYRNLLHKNTLDWDGQPKGKKDHLIITHEIENLELLVFYRKDKSTFPDYGFKYEGKFHYVSHTGSKPTHFIFGSGLLKNDGSFQVVAMEKKAKASIMHKG